MRKVLRVIDAITQYTAELLKWFCYALVLVIVYDVIMRYVFDAPTMWAFEIAYMLGGAIFVLGFAYTHYHRKHVRVDIFYSRLSPRRRAIIDVFGTLFLFFPLLVLLIHGSFLWMWRAWSIGEISIVTNWFPPIAPFRTVVFIGFSLLAFQAIAEFIRDLYILVRNKPYD